MNNLIVRCSNMLDIAVNKASPKQTEEGADIASNSIRYGIIAIFLVFGIFGTWSAIAPIDSAAIAHGSVVLASNSKKIQHLEGGIIREILVKEGMKVKKDDILLRLDETAAKSHYDLLFSQSIAAKSSEARLIAERDNKQEIEFPEDILKIKDKNPIASEAIDSQKRLFKSRLENLNGKIAILGQKINQFKEEIKGLEAQKKSANDQIRLLKEEIKVVKKLLKQGNAMKPRLLALKRQKAAILGQQGDYSARISRAGQAIAEAKISMINIRNEFLNKVIAELKDTKIQISDLEEKLMSSADTFSRIEIKAPISGTIKDLKIHTIGGVIGAGEILMDIISNNDNLIIEANVEPRDIDVVRAGLTARVRLLAYKTRKVPLVEGVVKNISADSFINRRTGVSYYKARVVIPLQNLNAMGNNIKLYPGMPADVLIVTGSRTLLSYFFSPITDMLRLSLRQQ